MARYQVRVQVRVEQIDDQGRPIGYSGNGVALEEIATVTADGWLGVTNVLGQFDALINQIGE